MPVASAQVKSCILLAGLYAEGETVVREHVTTRDHTEIALREFGADITLAPRTVRLQGGARLCGKPLAVPGDLSSAAFFIVAALVVREADLTITNIGLNPTRTALLDILRGMGASIKLLHVEQLNGELIGTLRVKTSRIRGGTIEGATTAALIDEIPVLAVLGAVSQEGLLIRDAAELRVKETDRIETIASNLQRMGIAATTTEDSLEIPGKQTFRAAEIHSCGDHRIAMAFSIAALAADGPCRIRGSRISFDIVSGVLPNAPPDRLLVSRSMEDSLDSDLTHESLVHDFNNVFETITEVAELLSADKRWKSLAATLRRSVTRGKRLLGAIPDSTPNLADHS